MGKSHGMTFVEHFDSIPKIEGECWLWRGPMKPNGYGMGNIDGREVRAHRLAYLHCVGPIPDGHVIHHTCHNKRCVNPAHLEPQTRAQHNREHDAIHCAVNRAKTHCPQGHAYDAINTRIDLKNGNPVRSCHTCRRTKALERFYRIRAEKRSA